MRGVAVYLWMLTSSLCLGDSQKTDYYFGTFPQNFIWGAGTSAAQIEGASRKDGRTPSVWDTYSHTPGKTEYGDTPDVAADSYHNYMEDIRMLQDLGVKHAALPALERVGKIVLSRISDWKFWKERSFQTFPELVKSYHMSISWSRLMLKNTTLNPAGVEYYRRVFTALNNSNIEPYVTLYYYDLPEFLERKGGWLNENIINDFKIYADRCFSTFGSLVKFWITMHDPKGVAWNGYGEGTAAPGRWEPGRNPYIAGNNLLIAHREVQDLYTSGYKPRQHGQLGISLTTNVYQPVDESDVKATQRAFEFDLGWFAEPLFVSGHYPIDMVRQVTDKSTGYGVTSRLPSIQDYLKTASDVDFMVLTIDAAYNITNETLPSDPPSYLYDQDVRKIKLDTWPQDSVRKLLRMTNQKYHQGVYVTGGLATENVTLKDEHRINFFKWHIDQVLKAQRQDKCNILGYVARHLMDSFEWSHGYSLRGGLFSVDFMDPARSRTPRASSRYYAQVVKDNGILPGYPGRGGVASGFVPYEDDTEVLYDTFPGDFAWAAATSSYQVEGAWNVDGKGPSIWDTLTHNTASVQNNTTGDVACDSYHKYKEDVQLLKAMNVTHYRFSIAWPRVLPNGTLAGGINKEGIDYYKRLIDELLKYDIKPMVTLYHWDLPQALEDKGGWLNESVVQWFKDYADLCFKSYGDNVSLWITFNEPPIIAIYGYGNGVIAPQKNDSSKNQYIVARNIILAHAEAYHLYNTTYKPAQKGKVGITINYRYSEPRDPYSVEDVDAAERAMEFYGGMFAQPIYGDGDFPTILKYQVEKKNNETNWNESRLPKFTEEEIKKNKGTYDFFGLNFYTGFITYSDPQPASEPPTYDNDQDAKTAQDPAWQGVTPWAIRKTLNRIKYRYNNVDVYITENGIGDHNGTLEDAHRVHYYRLYISEVLKAIKFDGCNVKGYTAWSLMDNFEWVRGYTMKFGLYRVDFEDTERTRTPKASAKWYRDLIEDNGFKPGTTRPGGRGTAVQMDREFYYGTFPEDFVWSCASSSFQVEGAIHDGNRGESIWDNFPVLHGDNGHVACDSYHKYEEDVRLLKNMGVNHYRFSIAWSRIFPDGTKASRNQEGIDYYHRLVDALLAAGIEPMVTLYHWDLPKALQDKGGWTNHTIIGHFKDYAGVCFEEYGKKVKLWITLNEPWVFTVKGLESGDMAPGHNTNKGFECYMAAHTALLAHAEAYHLYNDTYRQYQPDGKISITLNIDWAEPKDPLNPSDIEASEWAIQMFLGWFAHPVYVNGDYPDVMKERVANVSKAQGLNKSRLPEFTDEQKDRIQGTFDFFGMNHYTTKFVFKQGDSIAGNNPPNYFNDRGIGEATDPSWPPSGSSWLYDVPWGVRKILNWVKNNYGDIPIYITENGLSDNNGTLNDQHRIHFYRYYINEVLKALTFDKVDVRGYTAWALLDNFEWDRGYSEKFGTHFVNFSDPNRPRTPKDSAAFLRHIFQDNGFKPGAISDPKWKPIPSEDGELLGQFPEDFAWGTATSAYQIEGGYDEEGRGLSSWDVFSRKPGNTYQNQTGDKAAMSYTHYLEDVAALKAIGANAYHFSLSWSRILPGGTSDIVNQAGIDYYNDLIMALMDEEIQPIVSLHQWDTPAAITDGWLDGRVVEAFGNYSRLCFKMFGKKVKTWITLNEPNTLAMYGYELGRHAPGVKGRGYEAAHNMIRAHASAYRIYKSEFKHQNGKVGIAVETSWAIPKTNRDPGDWAAQDRKFAFDFDWFTDPVFKDGDYPDVMKKVDLRSRAKNLTTSHLPVFKKEEKQMIKGSADFLGMSYYTTNLVEELRHDGNSESGIIDDRSVTVSADESLPSTNSPWLHIYPKGIRMVLRRAKERYGNIPIYVTGNGVSDEPGTIKDDLRTNYMETHTNEVLKAIVIDDVNIRGYMAYSLIDSFEWRDGYKVGFGLYSVNFTDPQRQRHRKQSSVVYKNLIRDNGFFAPDYTNPYPTVPVPTLPTPTPKVIIKNECPPPASTAPLASGHLAVMASLAAVACLLL